MESPAATTTAGIYCKACGYDLRGSLEAGRCPECGRAFSPDDPKSFRKRPFAAPWKRALGRWAKRFAVLLLGLGLLLGGTWGWLYWGWKQERATLAQIGRYENDFPAILGGRPGWWLWDHRFRASFVLLRTRSITLLETATDADLLPLRKLSELEWLTVTAPITDAGLAHLHHCPRLVRLRVYTDPRFNPHVCLKIMGDPQRKPGVYYPGITDAGLAALRDLRRLNELELVDTSITGAGLAQLATLTELSWLTLDGAPLTDAGLAHLPPLKKLGVLSLQDTQVTDAGLVHLAKLAALEWLDLSRTDITDAGLVHLAKLPRLERLNLTGTKVTPAGVERLRAALPGCSINHGR